MDHSSTQLRLLLHNFRVAISRSLNKVALSKSITFYRSRFGKTRVSFDKVPFQANIFFSSDIKVITLVLSWESVCD